jgi:hypothetical protein
VRLSVLPYQFMAPGGGFCCRCLFLRLLMPSRARREGSTQLDQAPTGGWRVPLSGIALRAFSALPLSRSRRWCETVCTSRPSICLFGVLVLRLHGAALPFLVRRAPKDWLVRQTLVTSLCPGTDSACNTIAELVCCLPCAKRHSLTYWPTAPLSLPSSQLLGQVLSGLSSEEKNGLSRAYQCWPLCT